MNDDDVGKRHRIDLFPVFDRPVHLDAYGGITRRKVIAEYASRKISVQYGLPPEESHAEEISAFESPEKWSLENPAWKARLAVYEEISQSMGKVGFRILVDALAYKCGFRQVEWTKEDKVDWNRRVKENGGNRTQCILNHPSLRQETSLGE